MAPYAGLDPSAFAPDPLARRYTPAAARIVLRMRGIRRADVVFKRVFRPAGDTSWAAGLEAHRSFFLQLPAATRPAAVLFADPSKQAAIYDWVPGRSLHDHLLLKLDRPKSRDEVLFRAGKSIAEFHMATEAGAVAFSACQVQMRIARLRTLAQSDPVAILDADLFLALSQGLAPLARAAHGNMVLLAARHGDLSARNLILGPHCAAPIDFRLSRRGPVLHDLAALVADILIILTGPYGGRVASALCVAKFLAPFEAGYGMQLRGKPEFDYLLRTALLFRWAGFGRVGQTRSAFVEARLVTIQRLLIGLTGPPARPADQLIAELARPEPQLRRRQAELLCCPHGLSE